MKAADVHIGFNKKKILLILRSSKTHGKQMWPQKIKIASEAVEKPAKNAKLALPCPYQLLRMFANYRGGYWTDEELFFIFPDGSPLTIRQACLCFKMIIKKAGFDDKLYGSHSLRIGCSCDLLKLGLSVETIKKLGRWKSNVVFRYLKN